MSTVQLLLVDFKSLLLESKRRHPDVKYSVETVVEQLKAEPGHQKLEQINQHALQHNVAQSLISACVTGNVKVNNVAIPILHRLLMAHFVPKDDLKNLINAFSESAPLSVDIQLKILQCIPSMMQNYKEFLSGDLILDLIDVCSSLTSSNKSPIVLNAASAALQQLVSDIFDKASASEDQKDVILDLEDGIKVEVNESSHQVYLILSDLAKIVSYKKPTYMKLLTHIKAITALDIIENTLHGHKDLFQTHQELAHVLRAEIVPAILKILNSQNKSYTLIIRAIRIIQILLSTQLDILQIEIEIIISYLNHLILENDDSELVPFWEKVLVLEMYRNLFREFNVIKSIFENYDHDHQKKNVLKELLNVVNAYVQNNNTFLDDIVRPPRLLSEDHVHGSGRDHRNSHIQVDKTVYYLSKKNSSLKTATLDHLDKTDAPLDIPQTYPLYLIFEILRLYSLGMSACVSNLSTASSSKKAEANLEAEVDFANSIIKSTSNEIASLFQQSIYTATDDILFRETLKSLQMLTHSVGLLGVEDVRDDLLLILSRACITNVSKIQAEEDEKTKSMIEEQRNQIISIGGSLVDTISATIHTPDLAVSTENLQKLNSSSNTATSAAAAAAAAATTTAALPSSSRIFNPRHVMCFKTLSNLATLLGSTLLQSWSIIWITSQWFEYFVEGSDVFNGSHNNRNASKTTRGAPGVALLENSSNFSSSPEDITRLNEAHSNIITSIFDMHPLAFHKVLLSLTALSDAAFRENLEEYSVMGLKESPYNRTYYLRKIIELAQINPSKFLVHDKEIWKLLSNFFTEISSSRKLHLNMRVFAANSFASILQTMADEGFSENINDVTESTSRKSLDGLHLCLERNFSQGVPKEFLISNCETEIHLVVLQTLHHLIEKYDSRFQQSWNQVFEILNTPFRSGKGAKKANTDENNKNDETDKVERTPVEENVNEKNRYLVEKSFETLKLVLDEFLTTLPFRELKQLIDTLVNFAYQIYDLNISFSSVSYFWLISDALKSRLDTFSAKDLTSLSQVDLIGDVLRYIETNDEGYASYFCLDNYLLYCLAKLSKDEKDRAQVREGAIQTFFQIVDDHGIVLKQNWSILYAIAVPCVVKIYPEIYSLSWLETVRLLLEGASTMYRKYFTVLDQEIKQDEQETLAKWQVLVDYMQKLLSLNSVQLNLITFQAFQNLIRTPFEMKSERLSDLLFEFWSGFKFEYDLVNVGEFQDLLVQFLNSFRLLYEIMLNLSLSQTEKAVAILNRCGRYPILPQHQIDNLKPSKLQAAVLQIIDEIKLDDLQIQAALVQLLTNIVVYPFGVKSRIDQKLQGSSVLNKAYATPTFVAVSQQALLLMEKKFDRFGYAELLYDEQNLDKCIRALDEVISNKFVGSGNKNNKDNNSEGRMWVMSQTLLEKIVRATLQKKKGKNGSGSSGVNEKSGKSGNSDENHSNDKIFKSGSFWQLITESLLGILDNGSENGNDPNDETLKIEQFSRLNSVILPHLLEQNIPNSVDKYLSKIYQMSFLYDKNFMEKAIIVGEAVTDDKDAIDKLTLFQFNQFFGTTESLHIYPNTEIRMYCLKALFEFTQIESEYRLRAEILFLHRICFSLRRVIADLQLVMQRPLPRVQTEEMRAICNLLEKMDVSLENKEEYSKLNRLLIQLIPHAFKLEKLGDNLTCILQKYLCLDTTHGRLVNGDSI